MPVARCPPGCDVALGFGFGQTGIRIFELIDLGFDRAPELRYRRMRDRLEEVRDEIDLGGFLPIRFRLGETVL